MKYQNLHKGVRLNDLVGDSLTGTLHISIALTSYGPFYLLKNCTHCRLRCADPP